MNKIKPHGWKLSTNMTMVTVPQLLQDLKGQYPKDGKWFIDLETVKRVDSAGAAFLLHCLRYAKTHSIDLCIQGLEETDIDLMKAQGIWPLIKPYT